MEPFFVTCETCRARLTVRSAAAIGQIRACPRCESMVHIAPPGEAGASTRPETLRPRKPFARVEEPSQEAADLFAAAAVAALAAVPASGDAAESVARAAGMAEGRAIGATTSAITGSGWKHVLSGLWATRPMALVGAASAALLTVGGLALVVWPSDGGDVAQSVVAASAPTDAARDTSPEANAAEVLSESSVGEVATQARLEAATGEPTPVSVPDNSALPAETDTDTLPAAPVATVAVDRAVEMEAPIKPRETLAPAVKTVAALTEAADNGMATQAPHEPSSPVAAVRTQVFKIDPLDFDPAHLPPPSAGGAGSSPATRVISASENLPTDDITQPSPALRSDAAPSAEEPETITVRRGTPTGDPVRGGDVSAKLALPLRAVQMKDVRLSRFIEQVAGMAGIPITFSPAAVELTGIAPQQAISLDARETTIERLLRDTLKQNRMDFVERDGQLLVVRAATSLPTSHDVSDLAASEDEAKVLAGWIERLVAPESWAAGGGAGELNVRGTSLEFKNADEPVIGLILFCERLRLARGLSLKSRYPADRLSVESPYERIAPRLGRTTTFTFAPWTRLADVLCDWETESGVTMLVDWSSLADVGLGPESPASCSVIERTWADALDGVLGPLELGWRALDEQTIQIAGRKKLAEDRRLEFYALSKTYREQFASEQAIVAAIESELSAGGSEVGGARAEVELVVDPVSGRLMALADASAQRFLTQRFGDR